ncbi:PH domain-containing protein [Chitinophaga alhagiae]|nr:PH domain-containing protein [Chitinophaga alhagiae]
MKTYRSKIDTWLVLFVFSLLLVVEITLVAQRLWVTSIIIMLVIFFIIHLFLNTYYTLTANKLQITCGWLYKKDIPLQSIRKIMRTRNPLSAPALSLDRLLVFFDRQQVMISPADKEAFLQDIQTRNPAINI